MFKDFSKYFGSHHLCWDLHEDTNRHETSSTVDRGGLKEVIAHSSCTPQGRNLTLYHIRSRTQGERFQRRVVLPVGSYDFHCFVHHPWRVPVLWLYTIPSRTLQRGSKPHHTPRSFRHSFITSKHPGHRRQHNPPRYPPRIHLGFVVGTPPFFRAAYFLLFSFPFLLFLSRVVYRQASRSYLSLTHTLDCLENKLLLFPVYSPSFFGQ